jgi:phospholipase/carboxylesterase
MQTQYDDAIIINPVLSPKASIIWLHGLGASGYDFIDMVPALNLPEDMAVRFIFPHAPMRKITINQGYKMRAGFDIHSFDADAVQDELGMKESLAILDQLIAKEIASGIPSKNIVIAGFSQGATVALHAALSLKYTFAGILALSGFLLQNVLPPESNFNNKDTPILMLHGTYDDVVSLKWAELSKDFLVKSNFNVKLLTYPVAHTVCEEEIEVIAQWLKDVLKNE